MSKFKISGLQKLTLLDFPGYVACTVFTNGCNMRCPFCHNASLVIRADEQEEYNMEELFSFLKKRTGLLEGVAITGGEPTLYSGLDDFIKRVRELGYKVKLDTNGTRPSILKSLIDDNLLDYVAMDIKNCREKYGKTIGLGDSFDLSPIEESKNILMSGKVDFEFRTTVANPLHQKDDFYKIGEWLQGNEKYFLQQFKDSGDIIGNQISAYSEAEMEEFINILKSFVPNAQIRGV